MATSKRTLILPKRGVKICKLDPQTDRPAPSAKTPLSVARVIPSLPKSVLLHDWWLVKVAGRGRKGLAVGGFTARERTGLKVFCSAPICKRHAANTVEAIDGMTIIISGFINRSRTRENGFLSEEIYRHFLHGFPYDWEDYVTRSWDEDSAGKGFKTHGQNHDYDNLGSDLPQEFDDLPVTRVSDLLMFGFQESCQHFPAKSSDTESKSSMTNEGFGHPNSGNKIPHSDDGNMDDFLEPGTNGNAKDTSKNIDDFLDAGKDGNTKDSSKDMDEFLDTGRNINARDSSKNMNDFMDTFRNVNGKDSNAGSSMRSNGSVLTRSIMRLRRLKTGTKVREIRKQL